MAKVKCEKCGKEFKNERGLKIHMGLAHSGKRKVRRKRKKKVGRPKAAKTRGARKGKFVCKVCGRSFKMAMHLARHMTAAHGKKRRKTVKKARRRVVRRRKTTRAVVGAPRGLKVDALSIDQLLAVKSAVDGRLKSIARKMRLAKLRG